LGRVDTELTICIDRLCKRRLEDDERYTFWISTAIYADDAIILAAHNNRIEATLRLEESLFYIQEWLKKWRIRVNEAKSVQVTFTIRREMVPISNLERPENLSRILGTTPRSQIKLEKAYSRKQLGIQAK